MKIKIYVKSLKENHILYVNDKKHSVVQLNNKETNYDADRFIFKVCDMVSDWPKELKNENILDGVEYKIVITDEEEKSYNFINKFPKDIYRLENLINDVLGDIKNV